MMRDRAKWQVHGPVRSVTSEFAEWSATSGTWRAARSRGTARFHRDGRIDEFARVTRGGSRVLDRYVYEGDRLLEVRFLRDGMLDARVVRSYDDAGRLLRVAHLAADGSPGDVEEFSYADGATRSVRRTDERTRNALHAINGCEGFYGADGTAIIETSFDESGRPVDVVMRDVDGRQLRRLILTRDATGLVLTEDFQMASPIPPDMADVFARMPPQERERNAAALAVVFSPTMTFRSQSNRYDARGRLVERRATMGQLAEDRTTWRYDERGNRVEEIHEDTTRELHAAGDGSIDATNETRRVRQFRFDYIYDAHGNWTEKQAWSRSDEASDSQPSNIERRVIVYLDA